MKEGASSIHPGLITPPTSATHGTPFIDRGFCTVWHRKDHIM